LGHSIGLLPDDDHRCYLEKRERIGSLVRRIKKGSVNPSKENLADLRERGLPAVAEATPLWQYLKRPDVTIKPAKVFGDLSGFLPDEIERAEIEIKYEGYIERQNKWIEQMDRIGDIPLGEDMDYADISGLSMELRHKLGEVRPLTFGQASRIAGMTPAALAILMVTLKARAKRQ